MMKANVIKVVSRSRLLIVDGRCGGNCWVASDQNSKRQSPWDESAAVEAQNHKLPRIRAYKHLGAKLEEHLANH